MQEGTLRVVESESLKYGTPYAGVVTIEDDCPDGQLNRSIERLEGPDVKRLAIAYATSQGLAGASLSGFVRIHPVTAEGVPLDQVKDANGNPVSPGSPLAQVAKYRGVVRVSGTGR